MIAADPVPSIWASFCELKWKQLQNPIVFVLISQNYCCLEEQINGLQPAFQVNISSSVREDVGIIPDGVLAQIGVHILEKCPQIAQTNTKTYTNLTHCRLNLASYACQESVVSLWNIQSLKQVDSLCLIRDLRVQGKMITKIWRWGIIRRIRKNKGDKEKGEPMSLDSLLEKAEKNHCSHSVQSLHNPGYL